jgi:2,4-dienoyl-CoA reductase-like NADH-dependent reductase (Old Yellow Enzyme family)
MLFTPLSTPSLQLTNRIVMAPMTRSRAVDGNTCAPQIFDQANWGASEYS